MIFDIKLQLITYQSVCLHLKDKSKLQAIIKSTLLTDAAYCSVKTVWQYLAL
jgi:hypothetical protein